VNVDVGRALGAVTLAVAAWALTACGHAPTSQPRPAVATAPASAPTTGASPKPTTTANPAPTSPPVYSAISPERAQAVTVYALGLVGTPYRYGGNTPESGFDCSGLIAHVYRQQAGVATPRTVAALKSWGQTLGADQLRSGDIVVFYQNTRATHAGIYVGEGRFVHAPSTGGRVRLDSVTSGYWARHGVSYQRP
jgi:cell wall-associated NlpC family hydrolase